MTENLTLKMNRSSRSANKHKYYADLKTPIQVDGIEVPLRLVLKHLGSPQSSTIVTGPCYLTPLELKSLSKTTTLKDVQEITSKHPTFEDIVASAIPYPTSGTINSWQETHHYASLVSGLTGLHYEELLPLFIQESNYILEAQQKLGQLNNASNTICIKWTHDKEILQKLQHIAIKNAQKYLQFVNSSTLTDLLYNSPEKCNALQIVSTYSPEANGAENITAIESIQNIDNIWPAYNLFGIAAILLSEPKDAKSDKPRMNSASQDKIIYLGPQADLSLELKKIKSNTKTPSGCGAFGMLWHLAENTDLEKIENACTSTEKTSKFKEVCNPECLTKLISILEQLKCD